jgi:predicted DNA-binding protein with PD1-like motif
VIRRIGLAAMVLAACLIASADSHPVTGLPGARIKLIGQQGETREYQLVFEPHAEIMATLTDFILRNQFKSVHFTALGACTDAIIGFYDPATRDYRRTPYQQQMEIVSLVGDAAPGNGSAGLHAHIALGFADGTMHGGHLFEAHASPTLEMFLVASPIPIERKHDAAFNVDLLVP